MVPFVVLAALLAVLAGALIVIPLVRSVEHRPPRAIWAAIAVGGLL